jgi:protein TilB
MVKSKFARNFNILNCIFEYLLAGPSSQVTEQLIRKKSEHNELLIGTLEELSLHQEDIEKIEHFQNWCKDLRILLLQSNLIPKIGKSLQYYKHRVSQVNCCLPENLYKLKKLEYLNLAINNIERIENLEQLEFLQKLDLTLNFVGQLTSVESLRANRHLEELFLTGNPCTDFIGYRDYVITVLPHISMLDGTEITRTERLLAKKGFQFKRQRIVQQEAEYKIKRDEQKIRVAKQLEDEQVDDADLEDDQKLQDYWNQKTEHCPETRIEMSKRSRRAKKAAAVTKPEAERKLKLFADCGRPYSINEPKLEFRVTDECDRYELDLNIYKFLDTSLIDVDVQPNYIRVTVKEKIFQMALNDEVVCSESTSKRSQTTGNLLITMPKLNGEARLVESKKATQSTKR